jgi:hypothetical protein
LRLLLQLFPSPNLHFFSRLRNPLFYVYSVRSTTASLMSHEIVTVTLIRIEESAGFARALARALGVAAQSKSETVSQIYPSSILAASHHDH